jgi:hypothetical protein
MRNAELETLDGLSDLVVRSELGKSAHRSEMTLVCRQYAITFHGGRWTMTREDPDFHQRFIADVEKDRILGRWEASEDQGKTWRKDFDLAFERV